MLLFSLITDYSIWYIFPCIGIALVYSWFLYRKDNSLDEVPNWLKKIIQVVRFVIVFLLTFFLLSPMFRYLSTNIEKPIIVFAVDNSKSIAMGKDSLFYKNEFENKLNNLISTFKDNYEIYKYSFGDTPKNLDSLKFNENYTDFSKLFDYIQSTCANKNIGAIVIASDGLYNSGTNPTYLKTGLNCPVYTVTLGDTTVQKDLSIENVINNKVAFLGNTFSIKVNAKCNKFKNENLELIVKHNNSVVAKSVHLINTDDFTNESIFEIKANEAGLQHYKIILTHKKNEITYVNNYRDIVVDVINSKQKILLLVNSPHPDAGALKSAIETNPNFDLTFSLADEFKGNFADYNLIILYQLPSKNNSATQIIQNSINSKVPMLFVIGSQSSLSVFNKISTGLQINQTTIKFDEAYPLFNNNFVQFQLPQNFQESINDFPPLNVPFGDYKANSTALVLFQQRIKSVLTSKPLVLFFDNFNDTKVGIICGEGFWRWRLKDYFKNSDHELFNELINKLVQYLSVKIKKEKFDISYKNIYPENESIIFGAELYNDNFEPVNEPDVLIDIINEQKKKFSYSFSKNSQFYSLNIGKLKSGDYSFLATSNLGTQKYVKNGKFVISAINIESSKLVANNKLMEQLALKNNGKNYNVNSMNLLTDEISKNNNIVSVSYTEKKLTELINLKLIFFTLILLLSFEWFIRKIFGSY